jgi:hypothetical protein
MLHRVMLLSNKIPINAALSLSGASGDVFFRVRRRVIVLLISDRLTSRIFPANVSAVRPGVHVSPAQVSTSQIGIG